MPATAEYAVEEIQHHASLDLVLLGRFVFVRPVHGGFDQLCFLFGDVHHRHHRGVGQFPSVRVFAGVTRETNLKQSNHHIGDP